jgi:hypothetical protein
LFEKGRITIYQADPFDLFSPCPVPKSGRRGYSLDHHREEYRDRTGAAGPDCTTAGRVEQVKIRESTNSFIFFSIYFN